MMKSSPDSPNVIVLPPVLYAAGLAVGLLLHWVAPRRIFSSDAGYWIGGVFLAAGVVVAIWGRREMEKAGTNVKPTQPTTALVATGPFRFSRNPLYVALTSIYLGVAMLANALWVLALLAPIVMVMHFGVIRREERYLDAKFGDGYRGYRSRVRRYL